MTTILKIGKSDGAFYLNEQDRVIERIEVKNNDSMETNFPGSTKEGYNYINLESVMNYYMKSEGVPLSDIITSIKEGGFFNALRPGLKIEVEIQD